MESQTWQTSWIWLQEEKEAFVTPPKKQNCRTACYKHGLQIYTGQLSRKFSTCALSMISSNFGTIVTIDTLLEGIAKIHRQFALQRCFLFFLIFLVMKEGLYMNTGPSQVQKCSFGNNQLHKGKVHFSFTRDIISKSYLKGEQKIS